MVNSQRFKFPKTVLFGISLLYIILIIATYLLYFKEPVIVCAQRMLFAQSLALIFQVALNYISYHSQNKIVILTTLFLSAAIFIGALSAFFNLGLMCELYGF